MKKFFLIVFLLFIAFGAFLAYQGYRAVQEVQESSITQNDFQAQKVGTEESEIRSALPEPLPDGDSVGTEPAGSTCIYYLRSPLLSDDGKPMFRFCFQDGELIEKKGLTGAE